MIYRMSENSLESGLSTAIVDAFDPSEMTLNIIRNM